MTLEDMKIYCLEEVQTVPSSEYIYLFLLLTFGSALLIGLFGNEKGLRYALRLILVVYCILLYSSMVVFRETTTRTCHMIPFRSLLTVATSELSISSDYIMNIVVFVPIGFLLFYQKSSKLKEIDLLVFSIICMFFSISIELSQYMLRRGTSEIDDVITNTMGGILGVILALFTNIIILKKSFNI